MLKQIQFDEKMKMTSLSFRKVKTRIIQVKVKAVIVLCTCLLVSFVVMLHYQDNYQLTEFGKYAIVTSLQNKSIQEPVTNDKVTGLNYTAVKVLPLIYIITPTYDRPTQIPDLVRLSNTLLNVKNIHWIVVEDGLNVSTNVKTLLEASKIKHTYMSAIPPSTYMKFLLRGISQRNKALSWIRKNHPTGVDAVLYFADDDNSYTLELFSEIRKTKKISVFPVGFTGGHMVFQSPIVENGKVKGFYAWEHQRTFAIDMAGFALNVQVLFNYPKMKFSARMPPGNMEPLFLKQCCTVDELEPLANNCTKILVWHVRTRSPKLLSSINHIEWNVTSLFQRLRINTTMYRRWNLKT